MDCNPPGSTVHGILQAKLLEWVAIFSSRGSARPKEQSCVSWISCIGRWVLYRWATWETPEPRLPQLSVITCLVK